MRKELDKKRKEFSKVNQRQDVFLRIGHSFQNQEKKENENCRRILETYLTF